MPVVGWERRKIVSDYHLCGSSNFLLVEPEGIETQMGHGQRFVIQGVRPLFHFCVVQSSNNWHNNTIFIIYSYALSHRPRTNRLILRSVVNMTVEHEISRC
jgi:hypothetical protein